MGFLTNLLLGGGTDKNVDIPALIKSDAIVIDVRTPGEFSSGNINGSINIPYNVIDKVIGKHTTDKAKAIIVFCHSGARSSAAKKTLLKTGYTNVTNGGSLRNMRKSLESISSSVHLHRPKQ